MTMPQKEESENAITSVINGLGDIEKVPKKDAMFLKVLMQNPVIQSLAKAQEMLENKNVSALTENASGIIKQLYHDSEDSSNDILNELLGILNQSHIQSLIFAHDSIAKLRPDPHTKFINELVKYDWRNPIRMVGLSKKPGENLGITVGVKNGKLVVIRVLHGSLIHKQGLLNVGDVILEIDGKHIKGDPNLAHECLKKSSSSRILLKVVPSYTKSSDGSRVFLKCNFDFKPENDLQIPSAEAGLAFSRNEILNVVSQAGDLWWQAQKVDKNGNGYGRAGLIPSLQFQEKRVLEKHKSAKTKAKRKIYKLSEFASFDNSDFPLYEEMTFMPPFTRKVVAFLSHDGAAAHSVKTKLSQQFPEHYKLPITHTSNQSSTKDGYQFAEKNKIISDIKSNKYFEYAEYKEDLYGTKFESIRNVMKSDKICAKDTTPTNLKFLMNSEFMPYVIYLDEDNQGTANKDRYMHSIDLVLPHYSAEESAKLVHEIMQNLKVSQQWIRLKWLF